MSLRVNVELRDVISTAHWRAGLRVLRRHLRYAGANPRKLLWIARRALSR